MNIRIGYIQARSLVDGPGTRTVLFVQGCSLACPGCQSPHLWPAAGGREEEVPTLARTLSFLARDHGNVTLSGGEIMQQLPAVAELVTELRQNRVKHIVAYTGYTWEELHTLDLPHKSYLSEVLEQIDVLVDGRFVRALDDDLITYRGSRNQRPIDVPATLRAGQVITLDWDAPELVIDEGGEVVLPLGLAREFSEMGAVGRTRMCGQSR